MIMSSFLNIYVPTKKKDAENQLRMSIQAYLRYIMSFNKEIQKGKDQLKQEQQKNERTAFFKVFFCNKGTSQ